MLFRPEDGADLKDPLKYADHHLFIKLGTLREAGLPAEIVQTKNIGSAFGSFCDDFRGVNLCEVMGFQKTAHTICERFLDFENGGFPLIAEGDRPVIQQGFQGSVHRSLADDHRAVFLRGGEDFDIQKDQVKATSGTFFFPDVNSCSDTAFLGQRVKGKLCL